MKTEYPIEISCLYTIIVKEGDKSTIAEILNLRSIESNTWNHARERQKRHESFDEIGHNEFVIISDKILGWNYIICDNFYDSKYTLNCCDRLANYFDEIFAFVIDVHSGDYRFIKIKGGNLVRLFERDSESKTGEFGVELEEEIELRNNYEEEDYFHVVRVAEKILKKSEWSDQTFLSPVLYGKRYTKEIEKYKDIFFEPIDPKKLKESNMDEENLPF